MHPEARANVARYFDGSNAENRFSGRLFERFGGGGDQPDVANEFTAHDLMAVESLSVRVPTEAAFEILHGRLATTLGNLLASVPTDVDLGTPEAAPHLADNSPADHAWRTLDQRPGIGWVTAGKLLARKRPRLIPVYDEVVACVLGHPTSFWLTLDEALAHQELREAVEGLRPSSAEKVSTLRVLDVAIWMSHQHDHRQGRCD